MECLLRQIPLIAEAIPKRNQQMDTTYGRISDRSEYKEVLFELAGDTKIKRAQKLVNGNATTKPMIRTTGV